MGEVYRAHDPRFEREIAIKVLPFSLSDDSHRLDRFQKEARAVGALNHPNILTVHDVGVNDGIPYLVSELLEGETLRPRISNGRLSFLSILNFSLQIANGLSAAHEKGIIHRDLKPENIFVCRDNRLKILDFGLAKVLQPELGEDIVSKASTARGITEPGVILGTVAYMPPEQIRATLVDARSDIFSFGTILFEMMTGNSPFRKESNIETMNAILHDEPEFPAALLADAPILVQIAKRCLEKDPKQRFQSAIDLAFALEAIHSGASATGSASMIPNKSKRSKFSLITGLLLVTVVAGFFAMKTLQNKSSEKPQVSVIIGSQQLTDQAGVETQVNLSPDGKSFVYAARAGGNWDIFLQRVAGRNPINLTAECLEDDYQPSFSPDGEQIAFRSERDGGGIFLIGATGESVRRVTKFGYNPSWSPDAKEIVVGANFDNPRAADYGPQLAIVNIETEQTRLLERSGLQPSWSPSGGHIAYWHTHRGSGQRDIAIVRNDGSETITITNDAALDWNPFWSPDSNYLYFLSERGGTMNLWRIQVDERTSQPLSEAEPITIPAKDSGYFSFSKDGKRLAFVSFEHRSTIEKISFDPGKEEISGSPTLVTSMTKDFNHPSPSPDGQWVVAMLSSPSQQICILHPDGSDLRLLTNDSSMKYSPEWSRDGKAIAFYSNRSGKHEIWSVNRDGSGLRQLTQTPDRPPMMWPVWSPDGSKLAVNPYDAGAVLFDLLGTLPATNWKEFPKREGGTGFLASSWSPDGKWIAGADVEGGVVMYSIESGRYKKITDFGGGFWGNRATWLSDSTRLIFSDDNKLFLLDTATGKWKHLWTGPSESGVRWFRPTPDDRTIYYQSSTLQGDIYLITLK